jgi:hypothetical protein
MMSESYPALDMREQIARIDRALAGHGKFQAETEKLLAESRKFRVEREKRGAAAGKLQRDRMLAPWAIVVTAIGTGAALFAAGAGFWKVLGG